MIFLFTGVTFRFQPLVFWGSREYILTFDEGHTRGLLFIYIISPGFFVWPKSSESSKFGFPFSAGTWRKSLHVKHRKLRKSTV